MSHQKSDQAKPKPRKSGKIPTEVIVALIGGIVTIIGSYLGYRAGIDAAWIPIQATQTVEARLLPSTGEPIPTPTIIRSEPVVIRTYYNKYITAMNDQPGWNWELRAETETVSAWEKFTIHYLDNGKVALETYHGRFVTATDRAGCCNILRAATLERGETEEFALEQVGDNKVAFRAACGYYISAGDAGWNWLVRADAASLGDWEKFELIPQ